jgi:effector-binding domain-containing protein
MIHPQFERSFTLRACAAAVLVLALGEASPGRCQDDAEVQALVAKIDAWRGKAKNPPASLSIEGTFTVSFEGVPAAGFEMKGTFRQFYSGARLVRCTADLGEHGTMESGCTADLVWEVDPSAGARILTGAAAGSLRRSFAIARGASPRELYARIERKGSKEIDGRAHVQLVMTPAEGKPDTWYVDGETGCVARIDAFLPPSEGAELVWGIDPEVETKEVLGDWKEVGGVKHPHRRAVTMGPATFSFVCTKIDASAAIDEARFQPPDSVRRSPPAAAPVSATAAGIYEVKERQSQPVASVRVKCKPADLSATMATIYPEICAHLNAIGSRMTGLPFSRYHAFTADEVDLEAGFPVQKPITEKGRIKNGELPAGKVVQAWHIGPYEKLSDAHQALQAHLAKKGLKARGGLWEVYWTDPGVVPDPAKWRTQLFAPIE